jgi:rod shape-determining protein MreC
VGDFFRSIQFKILVAVALVLFGLMLNSSVRNGVAGFGEGIVGSIITPLQKLSTSISNAVGGSLSVFTDSNKLKKQNAELTKKNKELLQKQKDYDTYKNENQRLNDLLDIKEHNPTLSFTDAEIIAREPNDDLSSFTVDKGSLDGVNPKDAVITDSGLVGSVSEVGPTWSTVNTLLYSGSEVGAYISRTRDVGVVENNTDYAKKGLCKLSYLPPGCGVTKGDMVITSGIGGMFPKGITVGYVQDIKTETHGLSLYATVKPAVDVSKIKSVFIIKSASTASITGSSSQNASSGVG